MAERRAEVSLRRKIGPRVRVGQRQRGPSSTPSDEEGFIYGVCTDAKVTSGSFSKNVSEQFQPVQGLTCKYCEHVLDFKRLCKKPPAPAAKQARRVSVVALELIIKTLEFEVTLMYSSSRRPLAGESFPEAFASPIWKYRACKKWPAESRSANRLRSPRHTHHTTSSKVVG